MSASTVGDILSLEYGKSLAARSRIPGNIPVYGSNGQTGWHDEALIPGPAVIVGRKGSIGKVHYVGGPAYPIDTTYYVRPRADIQLDLKFSCYALRNLRLDELNSATGVPSLSREDAYRLPMRLPPVDEQRRIVALLDRAEAIRRRADIAREAARALIPALFTKTFGDPATLQDRFPSASMDEVIASKQLGVVRSTREQPEDGAFGYVRMNAITTDGRVMLDELRRTDASEKDIRTYMLQDGDLLFNTRNSIELVGKMGIYRGGSGNIFNNNIMRIRLHESLRPEFLNSYFLSSQGRAAIGSIKKGTTSVCAIYYKDLARIRIPLPPLPLQTAFATQARRIEAMAGTLDAATTRAEAVAAALSARLLG